MKGRTPTKDERAWLDAISDLGCIVCILFNYCWSPASPHHIDGKTKPGAHRRTIPLCGRHHQIPGEGYISRHGHGRSLFEAEYGTEDHLLEQTERILLERGIV